jgi:hypothetical protein
MKVYCVWEIEHGLPFDLQRLRGIYASEASAVQALEKLEKENTNLPEGDDYGFYKGTSFEYYENEVQE